MTKLLLIDDDSIFRLGLCTALESFSDLQIVAQVDTGAAALQILGTNANTEFAIDLVVLELRIGDWEVGQSAQLPTANNPKIEGGLQLCQQLKTQYRNLPIFLLTSITSPTYLAAARATGIEGYCFKSTSVSELVTAMRQVVAGKIYWQDKKRSTSDASERISTRRFSAPLAFFKNKLRQSGLRQINVTLIEVTAHMQNSHLSTLDWLIMSGRRRELLAARWVVDRLLPLSIQSDDFYQNIVPSPPLNDELEQPKISAISSSRYSTFTTHPSIVDATFDQLQTGLQNLTGSPLEIDIFRKDKKMELLYLILRKMEHILDELRFSQVSPRQVAQKHPNILRDLWQHSVVDFFGKYYTLQIGNKQVEVVNTLLQDVEIVQKAFLEKIPLVGELFGYMLFHDNFLINNQTYAYDTLEATRRAEVLQQNLLIELANSIVQSLLNHFADIEEIKQKFYDKDLMSTREIARFRNNLSWKYRIQRYIKEPIAIFESRYNLLILSDTGIKTISIYAPRILELEKLTGIQLAVTLVLEIRDAIAPRLRSAVAFLGAGIVYLLTQIVGRGIGLIGKGIIQGIGNSLQESRFGKNSEREK